MLRYTISSMNIPRINLNLLIALDALLTERHVTRAGEKLFLTQSAMSNALNQLREIFQDELLIRGKEGMKLTPRARIIQKKVRKILEEINKMVYDQPAFDPKTSNRLFVIGMSEHAEFCILPPLLKMLDKEAPHVEIKVEQAHHSNAIKLIDTNTVELLIGRYLNDYPQLTTQNLFTSSAIVVARKDHPLMRKKITKKDYLNAKHLQIHKSELHPLEMNQSAQEIFKNRHVIISLPDVLPALFTLQNNDLLATLPNFIPIQLASKLNLAIQPLPFHTPDIVIQQGWHRQNDNDPGHQWLRNIIYKAAKKSKIRKLENFKKAKDKQLCL